MPRSESASSRLRSGAVALFALALLGGLTAACAPSEPPSSRPVRLAIHGDPISLDPHLQNEMLTFSVLSNVFDTLTTFDAQLRVGPALAASWDNPDELTWRFTLRPGTTFHDGRPLEAEDVVKSLQRARLHPATALGGYLVEVREVAAEGPLTVRLVTARPSPTLLNRLAFVAVVPRDAPERIEEPVGTGAYRFMGYRPGEALELEAFEHHWRGTPQERRLDFLPVPDPERRTEALLAGEIDWTHRLPPEQALQIEAHPETRLEARLGMEVEYLHLMADQPPFDRLEVRQAIHLALDRRRLVEEMLGGRGLAVGQTVSPNVFGFDPDLEPPAPDPARARELLAEAGYPGGIDIDLEMREGRSGEALAAQLATVGIRVRPVVRPWGEMFRRLVEGEVAFYYGGVLAPSGDASDFFDSFAHTRQPERGYGSNNFVRYSDPELDALIEESGVTLEMLPRRELLQQQMRRLMEGLAYVPLFVTADVYGVRREVSWEPRLDTFLLGREVRRQSQRAER